MTITKVEKFPSGKKKNIRIKKLNFTKLCANPEVFEYINNIYIELFDAEYSIEKIAGNILLKLIQVTKSTDGFLAMIDDETQLFRYYCVYMDVNGLILKSQDDNYSLNLTNNSLLNRCINKNMYIISNNVKNDPRSLYVKGISRPIPDHPKITTFFGIPITNGTKVIGEIGLANAEEYNIKSVEQIIPLQQCFSNFMILWKKRKLAIINEIQVKKEVVHLKDSFIATISHEIRTPLNGIVGMAKLLAESPNIKEKEEKHIKILAECSTQLMEVVNDILDFSKMSSGGLILHNSPFNLNECINNTLNIIRYRASSKGLEIKTEIDENCNSTFSGDERRIKQVLFNLMTNAIKFTETGFIKLSVNCENYKDPLFIDRNCKKINFYVKDTGIGINPKNTEVIFEVFSKLTKDDNFYTDVSPGAGMGLAISRFIVEAMSGQINVESDGKNGSTFYFYIILDDEKDVMKMLEENKKILEETIILIVDDNEDNRIYLVDLLYKWGIKTVSFSTAREALNYMTKNFLFNLVLTDFYMPHMNGLEFLQKMRENGMEQPVICLSSIGENVPGKDQFDKYIIKPVEKGQLFYNILKLIELKKSTKINLRKTSESSDDNETKIIVAEDDHYNQIVITDILNSLGYNNITVVSNGKLCVEEIKKNNYNICLMDIKMPVMDGLQATKEIKKLYKHPKIIAVSASVLDSDKNRCYSIGVDGYIPKPIDKNQLGKVLENIIKRDSHQD